MTNLEQLRDLAVEDAAARRADIDACQDKEDAYVHGYVQARRLTLERLELATWETWGREDKELAARMGEVLNQLGFEVDATPTPE